MWICTPDTLTPGSTVLTATNISVWPRATREVIQSLLLSEGGVALEFPPKQMTEQLLERLYALRATKQNISLPVLIAELAMELEEASAQVSSSKHMVTERKGS